MRRGTIFTILFLIIGVAAFVGLNALQGRPPLTIEVVVSPLAEAWVRPAIDALNAEMPTVTNAQRITYSILVLDDVAVWNRSDRLWTPESHPDVWIPAARFSLDYAIAGGLPLAVGTPSLAQTPLVWGGFTDYAEALTAGGQPLDWERVAAAAAAGTWPTIAPNAGISGNLALALYSPTTSIVGVGSLLSGAASFDDTATPDAGTLNDTVFRDWLRVILLSVPNFNTLGASPAGTLASRGISAGQVALLPESEWVNNLRGQLADNVQLSMPAFPFIFDFPLVVWNGTTTDALTPPDRQAAVDRLTAHLLSQPVQIAAQRVGLRPPAGATAADGSIASVDTLIAQAASRGVTLAASLPPPISAPPRADVQRLLTWANGIR